MEPSRQRGAASMQKCVSVRRVADCPQYDTGTRHCRHHLLFCMAYELCGDVVGRCTVPSSLTTAPSRCSSYCPSSGVPPTSPCTRLGSPCSRVHFMTIKAGNVVGKVRRSLRDGCASSSAAIFHPVSTIY